MAASLPSLARAVHTRSSSEVNRYQSSYYFLDSRLIASYHRKTMIPSRIIALTRSGKLFTGSGNRRIVPSRWNSEQSPSILSYRTAHFGKRILNCKRNIPTASVPRAASEDKTGDSLSYGTSTMEMKDADGNFVDFGGEREETGKNAWVESQNHSATYAQWDSLTSQLSGSATLPFLLLQLPQILLNVQNLMAGNTTALFAVPWMGQLTGLLGNLSLLSYFAKKRETGAMVVQAVGVISTFIVLMQLAMAGSMPATAFMATTIAVGLGLLLNLLNYKGFLSPGIWSVWEDVITVGGLSVLPQVMWSTFQPYLPPSTLPGIVAFIIAFTMVVLARLDKLPSETVKFISALSAWTATLLFMWAPVAQMWTNFLNPANIRGLSVFTVLLAMIGNGLLLPRALFTRDAMWFTGSSWGTLLQGWGILINMYINNCVSGGLFWGVSGALILWLGTMLLNDSQAHSLQSPIGPLLELVSADTRKIV